MKRYKHYFKNYENTPPKTTDYDNLFEDISQDWQKRSRDLRLRRWKKLGSVKLES